MTPKRAKEITMTKCLFRQVHLDGKYFGATGFVTQDIVITSVPIVGRPKKLKWVCPEGYDSRRDS